METNVIKMTEYYRDCLQEGWEYQDFISIELLKRGYVISNFSSKKYQYKYGENLNGFEIKKDNWFTKSKRIYIECGERTSKNGPWVKSGILRKSRYYLIGNYNCAFLFSTRQLQMLYQKMKNKIFTMPNNTSKGFYIYSDTIKKIYIDYFNFKKVVSA